MCVFSGECICEEIEFILLKGEKSIFWEVKFFIFFDLDFNKVIGILGILIDIIEWKEFE